MKKLLLVLFTGLLFSAEIYAQCLNTGINGTTVNLPCNSPCSTLVFKVPHLKSTENYVLSSIPFAPFAWVTPGGTEDPALYADDQYSASFALPFSFCFYGTSYTDAVVGSNGIITFDLSNTSCSNAYTISPPIASDGGGGIQCSQGASYYPRATVMGPFFDHDPRTLSVGGVNASPDDRKIEWRVEGTSPCRRFVVSYFHIGMFGTTCGLTTPSTFQMVLYENTGIIEVFILNKSCNSSTNSGRGILGIQNWNRDQAVAAAGKNATQWNEQNTGYRFTPNGTTSRYVTAQLLTLSGTVVSTADTSTTTPGLLDIKFQNICPPSTSNTYIVKTVYTDCANAALQLVTTDTVTITKSNNLNATTTVIPAACASPTGSVTINVPAGNGAPPFTYSVDGGAGTTVPATSYTFNNLAPGPHTAYVVDAGGCNTPLTFTVTQQNVVLNTSASSTATSCAGVSNGTITIAVPSNGTGPYQYSINGGTTFQASNIFNGLAAGSYTVVVKDVTGCVSNNITVTVSNGAGLTGITTAFTNTSCPGVNNGSITINNPTNGVAPYQFSITNGASYQAGNVFNGLAPGTYTIKVKDANGCTNSTTINVTISAGAGINASVFASPTSCNGASNGSISVNALSGTPPYQYSVDGGAYQPSSVITGLAAGSHSVVMQDANGCTTAIIFTNITAGPPIQATATPTATSCPGVNNGIITVTPVTGTAPYQYSIGGGPYQVSNVFTGLAPGTYTITVKDVNGCTTSGLLQTVTAGTAITATTAATLTSCPGVNDGTITVTPTSGTSPYQYSIDGGAYQVSNIFTGLAVGNHNIIVKDVNGCTTVSLTQAVAAGNPITATTSATLTSCPGVSDGTITVTPTTGTSPYQYSVDGGAYQVSNIFTGLAAGNHNIIVKDANGCTTASITQAVTAGNPITATTSATNTSCPGVNNATITVTPTTGTAPYQYSINGGPYQVGNTFGGLAPGSYSITVKDANGCITAAINQNVIAGTALVATAAPTATTCNGASTGSITVTPTNGNAPYQFSINGGPFQASPTFNGLIAGNYNIVMQDVGGCQTGNIPVTVTAGPALSTTTQSTTNISCFGLSDGIITLNQPSLGVAPFQYSINGSPFQASPTFNGLAAGPYTIDFKDNGGCSGTLNVTLTEPTQLVASTTFSDVKCFGESTGVITASGTGGTSPYTFSVTGPVNIPYQPAGTFNVPVGNYTVYVKDNNGCIQTKTVNIAEPALLQATAVAAQATCTGTADGSVTVTANGGTTPYQYSLTGSTFQSSNILAANVGNYNNVVVLDNNGCKDTVNNIIAVTLNDNMFLSLGPDTAICDGQSVTLIPNTNAAPPTPTFSWTSNSGGYTSNAANPSVNPTDTTTYYVTAHFGLCQRLDTIVVNVKRKPVSDAGPDVTICYGTDTTLYGSHSNASGAVTYEWTPTNLVKTPTSNITQTDSLFADTPFTLTVRDQYGCNFAVPDEVIVHVRPPIEVFAGNDTIAGRNIPMQLIGVDVNGAGINNWEWAVLYGPGVSFNDPYSRTPVVLFSQYAINGYVRDRSDTLVLYGRTPEGCWGSDTVLLKVIKGPDFYMPTVFTPNKNGLNDKFRPTNVSIQQLDFFRIYNRWGKMVFETTVIEEGWDGTYKGQIQPQGTYVWQLQATTIYGEKITKQGTIVLIR